MLTDSLRVAVKFEKDHSKVIRSIDDLLEKSYVIDTECNPKMDLHKMFCLCYDDIPQPNGGFRKSKRYVMNRDGFTILVMGFTGSKAIKFKLEYMNAFNEMEASIKKNLPHNYIEALEALLVSEKEKQALAEAKKAAEEAKRISDNIIKEQAPKVGFAETAIMANDKGDDMLIRDVRRELESHGCDIAERSLREFLQEQGFFYKNKREWILTENVMKKGYAHYRYNTDTGIRNTVYMTRKGFEKTLYNIRNIPKSRESFISFGGKIFD